MRDKCNKITAIFVLLIIFGMSVFYLPQMLTPAKQCFIDLSDGASIGTVMSSFVSSYKKTLTSNRGWIDAYGLIQKSLGKQEIKNFAIISDDYGCLYKQYEEPYTDETLGSIYGDIQRIYNTTVEFGGEFLYVQTPYKYISNVELLDGYKMDFGNQNSDKLGKLICSAQIPYMDLRDEKSDWEYYNTDHHWTLESSFDAVGIIVDELNYLYDYNLDSSYFYRDIDNYSKVTYEDSLLGSAGIQVGEYYSGMDDLSILVPNFETELQFEHYVDGELQLVKNGDFWNAFINEDILNDEDYYNKYNAFSNGAHCETVVKNKKAINDKKVLLITHSYGRPMVQYLSLYFEETRYLDPQEGRYNDNYLEYIEEYKPDVVIVMYNGRINTGEINAP